MPQETLELVHLRASQINGCSACVYGGSHSAHKAGSATSGSGRCRLARGALLLGRRARGPRPGRGDDPARRPLRRRGAGRTVGRGGRPLRRAAARLSHPVDRHDQPLQPPQRHRQGARRGRRLGLGPDGFRCAGAVWAGGTCGRDEIPWVAVLNQRRHESHEQRSMGWMSCLSRASTNPAPPSGYAIRSSCTRARTEPRERR
ncbi:hypothetical protein [Streptomyces sp. ActVer]|uniref:hypothetical protein n=1 Tax=Streptomyces sp. ActVer TaxID=3014558 RepID=UPI002F969B9E